MTRFEYLTVLISIVIALGITEVTFSWSRLVQHRNSVRFSWLHSFWTAFALVLMIQFWWGFWNYRTVEDWSLTVLFFLVLEAITMVVCALLLTPGREFTEEIDLTSLYFKNARPFFLCGMVLMIQICLIDIVVLGTPILHAENYVRLTGAIVAGTLAWTPNRRLHMVVPYIAVALFVTFLLNSIQI